MTENLALWEKLGRTDPSHTKKFKRAGGFEGTAIKPMWSYKRMTEEFGPCGTGWGINEPSFQVVPAAEEVLVYCTVSIWYRHTATLTPEAQKAGMVSVLGEQCTVFGVGGDKVVGKNKYGLQTDDEAFKKAYTDAVTNALKMIGVGADVHMGMFDDNKYINTIQREFSEEKRQEETPKPSSADMKRKLAEIDNDLLDCQTIPAVNTCAKTWASIFKRDNWPKDFVECAAPKFEARRKALQSDTIAAINDEFPGGSTIVNERITDREASQHPLNA